MVDAILGVTAAFGPPVIYHFASGRPLTWDAQITGWHLFYMAIGVVLYVGVRKWAFR